MTTLVLASLLVSAITIFGGAAIAYLFPHNSSQD